jgi:predicted AlkP superfamily phosphohydrolase/phosphomutase
MNRGGVLVIGLDGGTLDVIGPLAERGIMPTFAKMINQGRSGVLRSTTPWYTIPGWISLMTGVSPGTHGRLHWVVAPPEEYFEGSRRGRRFVSSSDIDVPTFWDVAGAAGKRVAIVNMPVTYPAWPVNGVMVTGLLTPSGATGGTCYPEDLLSAFPGYQVDVSTSREAGSPDSPSVKEIDVSSYMRELVELTHGRRRLAGELLAGNVDLGVVVFVGPDRISHRAWPEQASVVTGTASGGIELLVEKYYRALDASVDALLSAAGTDVTVVVVADHGFGPPPEYSFAMNGWLREEGYLRLPASRMQLAVSSRRRLKRFAAPLAKAWKRRRGPGGEPAAVDWSATSAYAVKYPHTRTCGIVINRIGSKREGRVTEEDAPALLGRLRADLEDMRDPHGRRVVRAVHTRQDLGARSDRFPDLVVETEDPFFPDDGLRWHDLFRPYRGPTGMHHPDGIFVLFGPRVRGRGDASAEIVDVAPSVLGLLGILPPAHHEGTAREDLFDFPERNPTPDEVAGPGGDAVRVSSDELDEIERHLQVLGYVD